jgi:lipoic acid synthetase
MLRGYCLNLDTIPYEGAWTLQQQLVSCKKKGDSPDFLILLEHPPVFTLGKWGKENHLCVSRDYLKQEGIALIRCERGGDITYHGPGQLVGYPILNLKNFRLGVKTYVRQIEEVLIRTVADFGMAISRKAGFPGVWAKEKKIASIGIAVHGGIAFHGFALNYAHNPAHFELITPCGLDGVKMTSLQEMTGQTIRPEPLRERVLFHFGEVFDIRLELIAMKDVRKMLDTGSWIPDKKSESKDLIPVLNIQQPSSHKQATTSIISHPVSSIQYPAFSQSELRTPNSELKELVTKKPAWLKKKIPPGLHTARIQNLITRGGLHTVCQEACCPNQGECFGKGTATFLLMGSRCTRNCTFCAVASGRPDPLNEEEPFRVARTVKDMDVSYAVLTSVTRDDLPDGGAGHFVKTVQAIRRSSPKTKIECLIPDFKGSESALAFLAEAGPCVINHNIETISRLYPSVRPGAEYERSLTIFKFLKQNYVRILTKSGFMIGLGETKAKIRGLLQDLLAQGCEIVTIGQYLQPTQSHHPVSRFVEPDEFKEWEKEALKLGFKAVASGPFVRSSFKAEALYAQAVKNDQMTQ